MESSTRSVDEPKMKNNQRVKIIGGTHLGKLGIHVFGVADGDAIVKLDGEGPVIIAYRNIEISDSPLPKETNAPIRVENLVKKRNIVTAAGEYKSPACARPRKVREIEPNPLINNAGTIKTENKVPGLQSITSHSPLSRLPQPWKVFLSSFVNNNQQSSSVPPPAARNDIQPPKSQI
eukprot:TRINITY_DN11612_c0_g1_i1.p1 TRINITY_DN11612_c0_g1~~TRINITY_DN11612_c0_g1_i1.p1  ORF type:complete len:202 (-),score=45.22 TRINITY_DN11612_c0_g1_i1:138-668(-)